jgi:hypothetical protein
MGDSDRDKRILMFVLMMLLFTCLTFVLMYRYWKKSYQWRHKQHSHDMKFMDSDIAMHAILIENLNKKLPVDRMQNMVKQIFEKLLPGPKVITCKVLPQLDNLIVLAKQLREYKRRYRHFKRQNKSMVIENEDGSVSQIERAFIKKRRGCCIGGTIK